MNHDVQNETELRRYLLGELSEKEQVLVEQRLFLDDEYAELHQIVEDDLIDEYLANELEEKEREKFEKHFLMTAEHAADVRIAQALRKHSAEVGPSPEPDPKPFWFFNKPMVWLSVAALIILGLVSWKIFRSTHGPAGDGPQQAHDSQSPQTRPDEQQPAPIPRNQNSVQTADKGNGNEVGVKPDNSGKPPERRSVPALATVSYVLTGGSASRGGGGTKTVTIHSETKEVILQLPIDLNESYEKYRAELLSGERRIKEWANLTSQPDEKYGPMVSLSVSPDLLREQSYRIKLHGVPSEQQSAEPPTTYAFNVERR